jgi:putative membrane protein
MTVQYPKLAALALAFLLPGALTFAQTADTMDQSASRVNPTVAPPAAFMKSMAQSNLAEIELGNLAQQKASDPAVRAFGKRMVTDHTTLNDQLKQAASQMNTPLPSSPSPAEMQQMQSLQGMSGKAFDRAYMDYMLSDHEADVREVQREAEFSTDPAVKNLAAQALPVLENHLRLAENVAGQIGIKPRKGLNQSSPSR